MADENKEAGAPLDAGPGLNTTPEGGSHSATGTDLIPQAHGGAIRAPWTSNTNPRGSFRKWKKEGLRLLAEGTPDAAQRLIDLSKSTDHRAAVMATAAILERVYGKTGLPIADDDGALAGQTIDPRYLTPEERRRMSDHLHGLAELATLARERAAEAAEAAA